MSIPSHTQRPASYRTVCACAVAVLASLATQHPLVAGEYYLDAISGNDNNPGTTAGAPWQTMVKVRSSASAGDTIHILTVHDGLFASTWPRSMHFESPGITQYGITWFLDQPREVGQFANGDFWIVGPVTLTQISPGKKTITQDGESFVIHGNMIDPEPIQIMGGYQGYDSRASHFRADLCVDAPVTLNPLQSLVSTVSWQLTDAGCPARFSTDPTHPLYHCPRPAIRTQAVLTCLAASAPAQALRPPYAGHEKPLHDASQLRLDLLPNWLPVPGAPNLADVKKSVRRPWIDHMTREEGDYIHPSENMPNYGRDIAATYNAACLMAMTELPTFDRQELLISLIQIGVDNYYIVKAGGGWGKSGGAIGIGRKWPILFAGILLDNAEIKAVGKDYAFLYFAEDSQTFYITQNDVDRFPATTRHNCRVDANNPTVIVDSDGGSWWHNDAGGEQPTLGGRGFPGDFWVRVHYPQNRYESVRAQSISAGTTSCLEVRAPLTPGAGLTVEVQLFPSYHLGWPAWGERHATQPQYDFYSRGYRIIAGKTYHGAALCALALNAKSLWSHNAFFDYTDRHMAGFPQGDSSRSQSLFTENLWDAYRTDYGNMWTGDAGSQAIVLDPIGDRVVETGSTLEFSVGARSLDGRDDQLQFSAAPLPPNATFSEKLFTWTPTADQGGSYRVTFTVSDGQSQDSETITITVVTPNTPPVLGAIGDRSVRENESLRFSVSATDADAQDSLTYSATGLPSGAEFFGGAFHWQPDYSQAGSYQVTFTVSDGRDQDSETITITVANVNRAPAMASLSDRSVDTDSTLEFDVSAVDPDDDSLTYSASAVPAGASFTGHSFSWTPTSSQGGSYEITFTASDGDLQDSTTITVTVVPTQPDNMAPVVARCSPEPDSIQVPLNNLATLHITDAGTGVDPESVVIKVNEQIVYQGDQAVHTSAYGRCSRSGNKNDYRFICQAERMSDFDQTITVTVNAADLSGNVMSEYSYSYVTEMRSFGSNKQIGESGASSTKGGPATARDTAGNHWVAWHEGLPGGRDIYVARLTAGADAFGDPIRVTTDSRDQCNPDMAASSDGRLYLAWQDNRRGNWDIFASVCSDHENFSREVRVSDSNDNETNPALAVAGQSPYPVYVAWQDDRHGNQDVYAASSVNAFAASIISRVTSDAADQITPDMAVDGAGNAYVVWTDLRNGQPDLYGAASNTGPWANVPTVSSASAQTEPAVAIEPGGSTLHVLWVDDAPGNRDIHYASLSSLPTSPLTGQSIVDDTSGADQTAPTIVCSTDLKVFACWRDSRHAGNGGDTDLYFAELTAGLAKTNVLVGDDGSGAGQGEPAIGVNGYGHPYIVWVDDRNQTLDVYCSAATFIDPDPLDSKLVAASAGATIGADPSAIQRAEDVSIIVPARACQTDTRITISKILNPQVQTIACLGSYDFAPSGIDFDEPVTVTIPYRYTDGAGRQAHPYWYDSLTGALSQQGITDVENIVVNADLNALRFKTTHFTPFYLVASDSDDAATAAGGDGGGGGACSISATGTGSPAEMLVPCATIALIAILLRCRDKRRQKLLQRREQ